VVLVGRRRKAAYGRVRVSKAKKKSTCTLSSNLASNLRLRQDDKVKVVPLKSADHETERSGDLLLLKNAVPPKVKAVTFSPLEDSLRTLEGSEGGDELSDDEVLDRFVRPYTESDEKAMVKKGHVLLLRDENGKMLEFVVTHVGLGDKDEEVAEGMSCNLVC